ncbi:MAG: hypothetical protein ACOC11_00665 [Prolixibacteraceae bacterium]
MKNLVVIGVLFFFLFSCSNQNKNSNEKAGESVVYSIDELYANAENLAGKEVMVKGTVMHVCKHGGERCFLMGSNENISIRIEAGEKIGTFSQKQMGSDLVITGVLKEVIFQADSDHDHSDTESEEGSEVVCAQEMVAASREKADVTYFIDGIKINKEL